MNTLTFGCPVRRSNHRHASPFGRSSGLLSGVASAYSLTCVTPFTVLLPVALMLGKALVDIFIDDENQWFRQIFDVLGTPLIALLIAVIVGIFTLGMGSGMSRDELTKCIESGLPPVAGIILIVAAGGGFKQILVGRLRARSARPHRCSCGDFVRFLAGNLRNRRFRYSRLGAIVATTCHRPGTPLDGARFT